MVDWKTLEDAYGSAEEVPHLLARLDPDPRTEVWGELWSRICHQGSVYSASYPALPHLLSSAETWLPLARVMPLSLAAAIVTSPEADPKEIAQYAGVLQALRALALQSLEDTNLDRSDVVYLQQAVLAFAGDQTIARQLDRLLEGELEGVCPDCDCDLFLVVGKHGFFVTAQEWVSRESAPRSRIVAADPASLPSPGDWLFRVAGARADTELQSWIAHLFGTSTCPHCGHPFALVEAVRLAA